MKQASRHNERYGALYIVSTPIGNLGDITVRAIETLKSVGLIAAENVKHSRGLCRHYGINTRLTSYNQHNRRTKGAELVRRLKSGSDIALITSAGTPAVSDPGALLINMALEEEIKVTPIPGPSAVIAALSVSGLRMDRFLFLGFLSSRASKRRKELKSVVNEFRTMVFYEAPHRLTAMLTDLKNILGDRRIVVLRELTKVYEEVKRGMVSSLLREIEKNEIKGEITLVVAGTQNKVGNRVLGKGTQEKIEKLLKENRMSIREIATELSGEQGFSYRTIYKACLSMKKALNN